MSTYIMTVEKRDEMRFEAFNNIIERWAASSHIKFMQAWGEFAYVGYRCDTVPRPYSVTSRGPGSRTVTFDDDGSTRTIYAPVPFA